MSYEKYALIRDKHGYTDAKVAEATGIAADKLLKIADLFDVPVDVLIRE